MRQYFEKMDPLGRPLSSVQIEAMEGNAARLDEIMQSIGAEVERIKNVGLPLAKLHERGELSVWERIEYLADPGTFCPLHSIYDPQNEESGSTGVVDGLARINGKWCMLIGFNNKWLAGAWIAGQAENNLHATEIAKILRLPLVWLVNCSGVKLPEQEKVYAGRRGQGACFYRHAELEIQGNPVIAGIYGANPAGGGYQSISPAILLAHRKANMAVGGAGIISGIGFSGAFDEARAGEIINTTRHFKSVPPGSVKIHYDVTGFFRAVFDEEKQVLDAIRDYMGDLPAYKPRFFRVAEPTEPKYSPAEIAAIVPVDKEIPYEFEQVLARLVDGSEHMEFRPGFGPEVYCGLVKVDGLLMGVIGNRQETMTNYPEYTSAYEGVGGRLYRQGLIKMSEFITLCSRDKVPVIWMQDTGGIDAGDDAEKAELLGLGQSLIYSIENSHLPMMLVVLRRGSVAGYYVMGGPIANNNNAFSLGTAATEINVMPGETAAAATFARRLVRDQDEGLPLQPTIDKMNKMAGHYRRTSSPEYCAKKGFVDEIVRFADLRKYLTGFANCAYQNPRAICPQHHMILPRIIRSQVVRGLERKK
jgi:glutaconyl-CoA decarboxylase subunit alpha